MDKKKMAGIGVGLAVLGFAGAAFARGKDDDDIDDDGVDDEEDDVIIVTPPGRIDDPVEPPPPPPKPTQAKNYVGSGYNWPRKDRFPNEAAFAVLLNLFGYGANINQTIISAQNMTAARAFQRDFNVVLAKVPNPHMSALATDGLIGKNTIAGLLTAETWVNQLGSPWPAIVSNAKANA